MRGPAGKSSPENPTSVSNPLSQDSVSLTETPPPNTSAPNTSAPNTSAIVPPNTCATHSARPEAASSFARFPRSDCKRRSSRSALFASRIRLDACALHLRAISNSRYRSCASRRQSCPQASATTACAAIRPSNAVSGNNETTAASAARSRSARSAGLSVPGGGKPRCNVRIISCSASCGSRFAQSGRGSVSDAGNEFITLE